MKHVLEDHHVEHLKAIGIAEPPAHLEVPDDEYDKHLGAWLNSSPAIHRDDLHKKVLGHAAWKRHAAVQYQIERAIPAPFSEDGKPLAAHIVNHPEPVSLTVLHWELRAIGAILLLILASLFLRTAHGDPVPPAPLPRPFSHVSMLPQVNNVPIPLPVRGSGSSNPVYVICSSGCSAAGAFADNSTFTVGTTPGSILFGYYTSGAAPTLTTGSAARARIDANSYLIVDCATGCSSSGFTDNSAFTAGTTAIGITGGWYAASPTACTTGNACAPSMTIDRKMFVQDFQGTSPWVVSNGGTFAVQAAQSGTWTVTGAGGTFPVTGTFWQATQPISAAALPLPSGAATLAKQPALGTAGTASADVISVQGIASMTPIAVTLAAAPTTAVTIADGADVTQGAKADAKSTATDTTAITVMQVLKEISFMEQTPASRAVTNAGTFAAQVTGSVTANAGTNLNTSALQLDATGASLNLAQASTTSGQTGPIVQGATTTAAPSYTTAKTNPLSLDTAGNLRVSNLTAIPAGSNVIGHVIADTGSTTAVTGNVTVVQPTGTSLHAVLDTTSTTAVTQATAANLNAAVVGTGTAGIAAGGVLTVQGVASMTKLLVTPDSVALPANQSVNVAQVGGTAVLADPCQANAKVFTLISVTAGATLITGTSAKKQYICGIQLVSATAQNIAITEGTGTVCATNILGLFGGATAATGWNLAANGGLTYGNGGYSVGATTVNANNVCILTSSSGQISGSITSVAQ